MESRPSFRCLPDRQRVDDPGDDGDDHLDGEDGTRTGLRSGGDPNFIHAGQAASPSGQDEPQTLSVDLHDLASPMASERINFAAAGGSASDVGRPRGVPLTGPEPYPNSFLAITTRWIWLVPS